MIKIFSQDQPEISSSQVTQDKINQNTQYLQDLKVQLTQKFKETLYDPELNLFIKFNNEVFEQTSTQFSNSFQTQQNIAHILSNLKQIQQIFGENEAILEKLNSIIQQYIQYKEEANKFIQAIQRTEERLTINTVETMQQNLRQLTQQYLNSLDQIRMVKKQQLKFILNEGQLNSLIENIKNNQESHSLRVLEQKVSLFNQTIKEQLVLFEDYLNQSDYSQQKIESLTQEFNSLKYFLFNEESLTVQLQCYIHIQRNKVFDKVVDDISNKINLVLNKLDAYYVAHHLVYYKEKLMPQLEEKIKYIQYQQINMIDQQYNQADVQQLQENIDQITIEINQIKANLFLGEFDFELFNNPFLNSYIKVFKSQVQRFNVSINDDIKQSQFLLQKIQQPHYCVIALKNKQNGLTDNITAQTLYGAKKQLIQIENELLSFPCNNELYRKLIQLNQDFQKLLQRIQQQILKRNFYNE